MSPKVKGGIDGLRKFGIDPRSIEAESKRRVEEVNVSKISLSDVIEPIVEAS